MTRKEVNIIVDVDLKGLHFCGHPLSGLNPTNRPFEILGIDIWFPYDLDKSLFEQVERILTLSFVAHNVTSLEKLAIGCGTQQGFKVTYNEYEPAQNKQPNNKKEIK